MRPASFSLQFEKSNYCIDAVVPLTIMFENTAIMSSPK